MKFPTMKRVTLCGLMVVGLLGLSGCGSSGAFPTAKTTGIVTCQGSPVADAFVYFEPLEKAKGEGLAGKAAFARTGADGRFVLTTYDSGDGAVIGKHRVRVDGSAKICSCRLSAAKDVMEVEIVSGTNDITVELPLPTAAEKQEAARLPADEEEDD